MFKFESKWDVDTSAESLNLSLFGKLKKHRPIALTSANNESRSSIVPESDDEQYSKKDKKRLKKIRKKNRLGKDAAKNDLAQFYQNDHKLNTVNNLSMSKVKTKENKKKKHSQQKMEASKLNKPSKSSDNLKNDTQKQKIKEVTTGVHLSVENKEKKSRKRKRSLSNDVDGKDLSNNSKKVKVEKSENKEPESNVEEAGKEKRKRKRNRKKKNNSKKNKYKHLALNSANKAQELETNSKCSESLDTGTIKVNINKNNGHQIASGLDSNKVYSKKEFVQNNNKNISKKTLINNPGEVIIQTSSKGNHSDILDPHKLLSVKKTKNASSKHIPQSIDNYNNVQGSPKKKIKKLKKCSTNEAGDGSQSQPIREAAEKVQLSPTKVSFQNKKRQKQLLEMLKKKRENKDETAIENNQKDSALSKKKKQKKIKPESIKQNGNDMTSNGSIKNKTFSKEKQCKKNKEAEQQQKNANKSTANTLPLSSPSIWGKAAELGQQAKEKLNSARFRFINEQLYSCSGNEALQMFKDDQDAFHVYHDGFQNQASKWSINPLDIFIKQLKDKPKNLVIADFGCGEAKLAHSIPQKVYSFDLVALNDTVTVCDMSKTPLPNEKVDIAVFCLSLMGTNISDYISEANRVLKTGGLLKVAEVVSRFSGLSRFTEAVCSYGFQLLNKRDVNQMFYLLDFKKIKFVKSSSLPQIKLKPCVYKRR